MDLDPLAKKQLRGSIWEFLFLDLVAVQGLSFEIFLVYFGGGWTCKLPKYAHAMHVDFNCLCSRIKAFWTTFCVAVSVELPLPGPVECVMRLQRSRHSKQSDLHNGTLASKGHGQ